MRKAYKYVWESGSRSVTRAYEYEEGTQPLSLWEDGREWLLGDFSLENEFTGCAGTFAGHSPGCWPMESEAMGVAPEQAREAHQEAVAHGVPTEINPRTGNPILRDKDHARRYQRALGFHNRDASYGDATPD